MCGVVGYVGRRGATDRLLGAMERLEYRGYDSAGLCLLTPRGLELVKVVGKIEGLRRRADGRWPESTTGIGHTRWATHGRVTEENAHPLLAGDHDDAAIVLNGIIENHAEIRRRLVADGEQFASQTDAEVVVHLVRRAYRGSLVEAVRTTYGELEGHFAFIAMHREQPGLLVGTRRRCPLVVGLGDGENYLASSMNAFLGETRRVKLVEDGEIATITAERARVLTAAGAECEREETEVPWDDACADRAGHETYMLKEIHEQPEAVSATVARNLRPGLLHQEPTFVLGAVDNRDLARFRRIVIVACGTAYHAGLVGRLAIEGWADVSCEVDIASEWRYRDPRVDEHTLVIGISQSGETADTLGALRLARDRGARTLAITNSPGSQITREVDAVLYTHAGIEIGVAATKTFTAQLAVLYLLALRIAQLRGALTSGELATLMDEVRALPQKLVTCLEGLPTIEAVAERHYAKPFFLYLGRHAGLPVCLEGALKLKEVAYIPTEAYAAGEMKHGPIALLDHETPVVCVATRSHVSDTLHSNLEEVRARGAQVIAIATLGDGVIAELADEVLEVPQAHPLLQPALAVVPLQLLAYHIARRRGLDVDQPRNLAKTVTVE